MSDLKYCSSYIEEHNIRVDLGKASQKINLIPKINAKKKKELKTG